jgi:hypothetical protein
MSAAHCFLEGYTYINAFVNTTYNPYNRLVRGNEIFAHVEDWNLHEDFDRNTGEVRSVWLACAHVIVIMNGISYQLSSQFSLTKPPRMTLCC